MEISKELLQELAEACDFYSMNTSDKETATYFQGKKSAYLLLLEHISK